MRASAYYRKLPNNNPRHWDENLQQFVSFYEDMDYDRNRWELVHETVEGIYCGERYLSQQRQFAEHYYPRIRTFLVAIDHRRRVSVQPSDVEVVDG